MKRRSVIVMVALCLLGSLTGCREAADDTTERSVPYHIDKAVLLPAESTRIDVESLTKADYEGGPVLVLDESRIAIANAPTGTVYLGTEGPRDWHAITSFGTGPAELMWVSHLARAEEGLFAGGNGDPPIVRFFSVNETYRRTVRMRYNYGALDTVGGALVGFSSHPRQLRTSNTEPALDGVSTTFRSLTLPGSSPGHTNYSRVVLETTQSDLSCLKVRKRGDMVALPISRSMRTGRYSFHGWCFEERPAETFCIEQTYTISISTTSGALQPNSGSLDRCLQRHASPIVGRLI